VNQTFAGGNAAVTMAKLYDTQEPVAEGDASDARFDSGLTLSEPPKANAKQGLLGWRKKLFGLSEPGEVRPFFFGTDTQLGMKVGWNGVGGPYPDTVKLGFNRKEIAVAPVTISENNVVRIPSFLATVDSAGKGSLVSGTDSLGVKQEVNWIQYFATGKSAEYLARQHGVRKAMLERVDPKASAISKQLDQARLELEPLIQRAHDLIDAIDDKDQAGLTNAVMVEVEVGLMPEESKTPVLNAIATKPEDVKNVKAYLKRLAVAHDPIRGEQLKAFIKRLSK
jgi:hypothetical protein